MTTELSNYAAFLKRVLDEAELDPVTRKAVVSSFAKSEGIGYGDTDAFAELYPFYASFQASKERWPKFCAALKKIDLVSDNELDVLSFAFEYHGDIICIEPNYSSDNAIHYVDHVMIYSDSNWLPNDSVSLFKHLNDFFQTEDMGKECPDHFQIHLEKTGIDTFSKIFDAIESFI